MTLHSLNQYGPEFQIKCISSLLSHKEFLVNINDIISEEYFENQAHRWTIKEVLKYYEKYHTTPSLDILKAELQKMIPFVQDILDQESYIRMRKAAYPGEQALIRALWEFVVEGNRQTVDALQARRIAVKKRYPKPENKHWMVQSEEYLRILPNTPQDILREIDEDLAHQIAFNHGVEGEDAQPLSTRKTLEEYAEEALSKRARGEKQRATYGNLPQGKMGAKITLEDIEEAIEKQERHAKDSVPVAPDEQ